jgi:hypothetical protein
MHALCNLFMGHHTRLVTLEKIEETKGSGVARGVVAGNPAIDQALSSSRST